MTIQTKFNIGDLVAYTYEYDNSNRVPCDKCYSKGKILVLYKETQTQLEVTCPFCKGIGSFETRKKETATEQHTINRIMYDSSPWCNTDFTHYGFEGKLKYYPDWNVFAENKCTLIKTAEQLHEEQKQQKQMLIQ